MREQKLTALPLSGHAPDLASLAAHLREQADWVESGQHGEVRRIILVFEAGDGLFRQVIGQHTSRMETVGLLTMMAAEVAAGG